MAANVELWMSFDGRYHPTMSIPVDTCQHFSIHPLTWLRYLAYTIYGNKGYISTSPDGTEVEDYYDDIVPGNYYYVSQEPLLLDPDTMEERSRRTSGASTISTGRGNFNDRVAARDKNCVMTGSTTTDACHLIPHAKGHQYLTNLMNYRNQPLNPPLDDINDTRNGILLAVLLYRLLGDSCIAFLHTPNFAMSVNDVDLVMQPTADLVEFSVQPSLADTRLTLQHFNINDGFLAYVAPHNSDARQSDNSEWPPDFIFDIVYGCAALKTWGVIDFVHFARERTRNIYYDFGRGGGDEGDGDQNGGNGSDELSGLHPSERICNQDLEAMGQKKTGRRARNKDDDQAVDFPDMIMALWMQNTKKCPLQAYATKVNSAREKVQTWLESTES